MSMAGQRVGSPPHAQYDGTAIGPSLGGILFSIGPNIFFATMIGISILSAGAALPRCFLQNREICIPAHTIHFENIMYLKQ